MERNPNDSLSGGLGANTGSGVGSGLSGGTGSGSALGAGTDSISVTGTGLGQNASTGGYGGGEGNLADVNVGGQPAGLREKAGEKLGQAREMASERLGQVKEKASNLSATLADKLEARANSLRSQSNQGVSGQQFAGVDGTTTTGTQSNAQLQKLSGTAADAMQKTADFLRNGDLAGSLENQVRTNPGRTLLIALGVGYALGKARRRR